MKIVYSLGEVDKLGESSISGLSDNVPHRYPRPAIRKGFIKITCIHDIDFDLPIVQEKLFATYLAVERKLRREQGTDDREIRPTADTPQFTVDTTVASSLIVASSEGMTPTSAIKDDHHRPVHRPLSVVRIGEAGQLE
jgi:hypothetical protein